MLSLDTLNLLAVLLSRVTLSPTDDTFEERAVALGRARRELIAELDIRTKVAANGNVAVGEHNEV